MLNTLPALPHKHLPAFLATLTPLASSNPALFEPHLRDLLAFLPPLIVPPVDAGPTPTVARPNPGSGSSFVFPPPGQNGGANGKGKAPEERDVDEEEEEVRKAALEFMISLSEARPAMVKRVDGWTAVIVRGCLEGMGEIPEDETDVWLEADVSWLSFSAYVMALRICGSPARTRPTTLTRMCTSSPSIASRVHWVGRPCCLPRSSSYPPCLRTMTGD